MPDLPDDLRALLRERAEDAPAVPPPSDRMVRTVRRRQAVRASLAAGGAVVGVVAVVALAAAAVRPDARVAPPVAKTTTAPPAPPSDDTYEFCSGPVYDDLRVSVHPSELKFGYGCYRVKAGATAVTFVNPQRVGHNLVVAPEGGEPFWKTDVVTNRTVTDVLPHPLTRGDYTLTCMVHPSMHAQLVVR